MLTGVADVSRDRAAAWYDDQKMVYTTAAGASRLTRSAVGAKPVMVATLFGEIDATDLGPKAYRRDQRQAFHAAGVRKVREHRGEERVVRPNPVTGELEVAWLPPPPGQTLMQRARHWPGGLGDAPVPYIAGAMQFITENYIAPSMDRLGESTVGRFKHAVLGRPIATPTSERPNVLAIDRRLEKMRLPEPPSDPAHMTMEDREFYLGEFFAAVTGGAKPSVGQRLRNAGAFQMYGSLVVTDQAAEHEVLTFLRTGHFSQYFDPNNRGQVSRILDRLDVLQGPVMDKLATIEDITREHLQAAQRAHQLPPREMLLPMVAARDLQRRIEKAALVCIELEAGTYEPQMAAEDDFLAASFEVSPLAPRDYNKVLGERCESLQTEGFREDNPEMAKLWFGAAWRAYQFGVAVEKAYQDKPKDRAYHQMMLRSNSVNDHATKVAMSFIPPGAQRAALAEPDNLEAARQDALDVMSAVQFSQMSLEDFEARMNLQPPIDLRTGQEAFNKLRFASTSNFHDGPTSIDEILGVIDVRTPELLMGINMYGQTAPEQNPASKLGLIPAGVGFLEPRVNDRTVEAVDNLRKVLGDAIKASITRDGWVAPDDGTNPLGGTVLDDNFVVIDNIGVDVRRVQAAMYEVQARAMAIPEHVPAVVLDLGGNPQVMRRALDDSEYLNADGTPMSLRDVYLDQVQQVNMMLGSLVRTPTVLSQDVGSGLVPPVRPDNLGEIRRGAFRSDHSLA
jgi:hypothetical protein